MFALQFLSLLVGVVFISNGQVEEVDVIIMGAGMTGISAGHTLDAWGIDNFIILEAQDYIGGRTKTMPFGSKNIPVNVGGSWISGACCCNMPKPQCEFDEEMPTQTNPCYTLAQKYNLQYARTDIHEWKEYAPYLNGTNHVIRPPVVTAEYEKWFAAQYCLWPLIEGIYAGIIDDMSYQQGLDRCFWREPLNFVERTIQWVEFNLEYADNINYYSLGLSELETYYVYGNQDLLVTDPRGYNGVVTGYAAEYLDLDNLDNEPKIALNTPIERVEYDENGVTVYIKDSDKVYHGKYGLVTFSVGVLKSNVVQFSPALPLWKRAAITNTGYAHYSAVYIEWPTAFWSDSHPEIDENNLVVMVDERYGWFPWFINLNHESLLPGSLIWRFDITEETALKFQNQPIEQSTQEIINDKIANYFSPGVVPEPLNVYVGNWSLNEYVQGAYSSVPVGYDWDKETAELQWNVNERLYFGGEATSDESGYVHGAYMEGDRVIRMIINCLGAGNTGQQCQGPYNGADFHAFVDEKRLKKRERRKHRFERKRQKHKQKHAKIEKNK